MNILKLLIVVFQIVFLKLMGIKIIWTVHNLKNHENVNLILDRIYSTVVARLSNAVITHYQAAKEEVMKEFSITNKDKLFVVPHRNYIDFYENNTNLM